MRVIVTRPAAQAEAWVQGLRATGLEACALPLIEIAAAPEAQPIRQAWARLAGCALVMFVSAHAVEHFFAQRPGSAGGWPPDTLAGCTGPGTGATLRAAGVPAGCVVEPPAGAQADSEGLWQALRHHGWAGRQVLVVRGEHGRDWLAETLTQAGATVRFLSAYARRVPQPGAAGRALLAEALDLPQHHAWVFSSGEAVGHLAQLAPGAAWGASRAVATHPRIAAAVRHAGFGRVEEAQGARLPAVCEALARLESQPL
ncbi:MAG: hypothetical protein RI988_3174 [Pseudomonadota bacterium]